MLCIIFELIKDIYPNGGSNPDNFTYFNSKLVYTVGEGMHGREPWISDGSKGGTFIPSGALLKSVSI